MSGGSTVRALSQAWASASAPAASASVELAVEGEESGELAVRFAAPRRRPVTLERTAARVLSRTAERLPSPLHGRLAVEAGEVRALLRRNEGDGGDALLFSRVYRMASCRGVVLGIREEGGAAGFASPWTGTLPLAEVDAGLPLLLAPSAVLALVSYALEVTGSHLAAASGAELQGITVVDTAESPYPPQHHPFAAGGTLSPDRPLIADGRWANREEHAGDPVDPLFYLLTRPDRALRPLAAATHFNRRNLAVGCRRTVPAPAAAVLVDSWRVRVGPRSGPVPFQAELSTLGPAGERLAVTQPMALQVDPWRLLAQIQGASEPPAPAVDEDPIEGDGYGRAPTLVTTLTLADLAAPEGTR